MNILLVCSAGMSTSLLVTKMEKAAQENGKDYKIWAVAEAEASNHIPNADVVLIGPQMRFWKKDAEKLAAPHGIPVDVISPVDYGMNDGQAVLSFAEKLANKD
ncbi:PTS sugar transporter subunit IIB [Virgibacillus sp. 179-BFC.A HS]|uniref:PTS sugar transporter subunit IIB n=1 Tax=Tigheibacillus jepli TaxID=3035914 RepID=A0ABU5CLY6_9BACI|nr:PTS sugar transporter subunit IIB [Virgibacillus sp. 179-BFC.A HS]MDY0406493.1 PTS sugar transporter subunit IIB [Virgibacillus sp. 179-BFC.A HS]